MEGFEMKNYTIVLNVIDLEKLKKHIDDFDYHAFDTETTGLNVRKDKVIGLSVSGCEGTAFYLPHLTWSKEWGRLKQVWSREVMLDIVKRLAKKQLLMWNASYDIRIVKNDLGIDLTEALLADIMLMKHTVDEDGDFRLKESAIALATILGIGDAATAANEEQIKLKENVIANGGSWLKANKEMYKADLDVMGPYACADADLTIKLGHHYQKALEQEGLEEFFYEKEVMPLYKYVTIIMEEKGVHLDLTLILQTQTEIEKDLIELEQNILNKLLDDSRVRNYIDQRALENYPPKPTGKFAQRLVELYKLPLPKLASGKYTLSEKHLLALPDTIVKGFLLQTGACLPETEAMDISIQLLEEDGALINISSKQQMGQIVFNYLGFSPLSHTDGGSPQFDDDMIQHLIESGVDWAKDLSNYNKLIKIKGTYIERFLEVQENGIFYPSFGQHKTISGRYGSDLQQLPRPKEEGELDEIVLKYNNLIRKFFISGPGRAFVDDDYESLEPHVFAHVSGDEGLRDIFRKGHDFYSTIAIATEKMTGVSADKKDPNYLGKINKPRRQSAKAYSLGVPYGMTAFALGKTLGISTKEAQKLIDGYLNGFPNLKKWMKDSESHAQMFGFVRSETGRIRHLPRVKELYAIHKDKLLDYAYKKSLEKRHPAKLVQMWYMDYKNGVNNAKNFQIQSLSASIVNMAAIAINKRFKELGIDGWVALQIHDQLVMNVPVERAEECGKIVQDIMENNYQLSLKLKAPAAIGYNLKDAH
jgi:DNA polymerase I-like protein with 3'-5' exonuclease and polymerase domains